MVILGIAILTITRNLVIWAILLVTNISFTQPAHLSRRFSLSQGEISMLVLWRVSMLNFRVCRDLSRVALCPLHLGHAPCCPGVNADRNMIAAWLNLRFAHGTDMHAFVVDIDIISIIYMQV